MPDITREEVAHLARLSRLALDDAELDALAGLLDRLVAGIDSLPVSADEPLVARARART